MLRFRLWAMWSQTAAALRGAPVDDGLHERLSNVIRADVVHRLHAEVRQDEFLTPSHDPATFTLKWPAAAPATRRAGR